LCSSSMEKKKVVVKRGANISDRCVLLPGVEVDERAVLGSGTVAPPYYHFLPKSVHVGYDPTKGKPYCLEPGDKNFNMSESDSPTPQSKLSPFGEAFYNRKANYFVVPLGLHVIFNFFCLSFIAAYQAGPIIGTILVAAELYEFWKGRLIFFIGIFFATFLVINFACNFFAIAFEVAMKWILLGRRKPGNYNWDASSYCQRWQFYLMFHRILLRGRRGLSLIDLVNGSAYIVWYFRSLGCQIGKNVCLYPTGGDPMMTEPDLVSIENGVCINDASVVAHINSRGHFYLNPIKIGYGATLRSFSRVLSGAVVESEAKLLEHTLIMGGDMVSTNTIWQGWPAKAYVEPQKNRVVH